MKYALCADLHLFQYANQKQNDIIKTFENMILQCESMSVTNIIVCGDLFHGKHIIHNESLSLIVDFFNKHSNFNFILIDGNHDLSGKNEKAVSALKSLNYLKNVHRIEVPTKLGQFLFVPYFFGMENFIKNNKAKFLVSHFGLSEAKLNSGISVVSDICMKDLKDNYRFVFLGHYHKPQEISTKNCKVFYTGSIIELDWGERNDEKRFLVLDTDNDKIYSFPTEGYKKHILLEINEKNKDIILKKAKEELSLGNIVRLEKSDPNLKIDDIKDLQVLDTSSKENRERGITLTMDLKSRFEKYLEIKKIPVNLKEEYLKIALEVAEGIQ